MAKKEKRIPWKFLDEYRGRDFSGEWPTFPELLEIQSKRFAERPYFTDFDGPDGSKRSWTYSQVNALVHQIADFMISEGIKKGDRIAVSGKNSPEWGMVYLAALYASAIIVPVDNGLYQKEVENIVNGINHAGSYDIYSSSDKTVKLSSKVDFDKNNLYGDDQIGNIEKFLKQELTTYKHTFKKASDGSYYWYSTEPIK